MKPLLSPKDQANREELRQSFPGMGITRADLHSAELRIESMLVAAVLINEDNARKILMKLQEAIDALNAANTQLGAINTEVTKVSGETDTLLQKITDLQNAASSGDVPQALADAITAVSAQAGTVQSAVQALDDKVPDAPSAPATATP